MGKAIELIKAARAKAEADKSMQETIEANKRQACIEAFKPIRELWEELQDLEVPHYRDRSKRFPLSHRLASRPEVRNRLEFWTSTGNYGHSFFCEYGETGPVYVYTWSSGATKTYMTLDELTKKFIDVVANEFVDPETKLGKDKKSGD